MKHEPWHLLDLDANHIVGHESNKKEAERAAELVALNLGHQIKLFYEDTWLSGRIKNDGHEGRLFGQPAGPLESIEEATV